MKLIKTMIAAAVALSASSGFANTVVCGNYTLTAVSIQNSCFTQAGATLSGNPMGGNADEFLTSAFGTGYVTIDKNDDLTTGTFPGYLLAPTNGISSGSFSINPLVYSVYESVAIGFKSGRFVGASVFILAPGTSTGTWSTSGTSVQNLSHAIIYGRGTGSSSTSTSTSTTTGQVPLPGSVALLGLGLIALAVRRK